MTKKPEGEQIIVNPNVGPDPVKPETEVELLAQDALSTELLETDPQYHVNIHSGISYRIVSGRNPDDFDGDNND